MHRALWAVLPLDHGPRQVLAKLGPAAAPAAHGQAPRICTTFLGMKTSTIPSVRVEPELRDGIEALLTEGETVSQFVEAAVRATVQRRREQSEFIARGLRSLEDARRNHDTVDAQVVLQRLQTQLDSALQSRSRATAR